MTAWRKLWTRLPYDGQGLVAPADARLKRLRRRAAADFWRRLPWALRPAAIAVTRLAWTVAGLHRAWRFARRNRLGRSDRRQLAADCLASGAQPLEAFVWRRLFSSRHPLPARSAGLLLWSLGDPAGHRLLLDKQATGELLQRAGLAVPTIRDVIARGASIDLAKPLWQRPAALFAKPRRGSAGDRTLAFDVPAEGMPAALATRLGALARRDDLLVQDRIGVAAGLADFATDGRAPVLRLTTVQPVQGEPLLYSAHLAIPVPGEHPRHFRRGHFRAPVDLESGALAEAVWFRHPRRRYDHLPWSGAPLAGRPVTGFSEAVRGVLQAMTLLPPLAIVSWDVIPGADGPVILEGNSGPDWILTRLGSRTDHDLMALLERWSGPA